MSGEVGGEHLGVLEEVDLGRCEWEESDEEPCKVLRVEITVEDCECGWGREGEGYDGKLQRGTRFTEEA